MRFFILAVFILLHVGDTTAAVDEAGDQLSVEQAREYLHRMVGDWRLQLEITPDNGESWVMLEESDASVVSLLNGLMVRENLLIKYSEDFQMMGDVTLSFDPFRKVYRVVWSDSLAGLLDVYEGSLLDGKIVVTNLNSKTTWIDTDGSEMNFKIYWGFESENERTYTVEKSEDSGLTWQPYYRGKFIRTTQ